MLENIYAQKPKPKPASTPLASYLKNAAGGASVAKPKPAAGDGLAALLSKLGPPKPPAAGATPFAPTAQQHQGYNYSFDPALEKIHAANAGDLQQAEVDAKQGQREALTEFGDKALAALILGAEDPTVGAINDDPEKSMSVLARIARANKQAVAATENDLNAGNLFYGGARGKALQNLETDRLTNVTDAEKALQAGLGEIADALAGVKKKVRDTGGTETAHPPYEPGVPGTVGHVIGNIGPPAPGVIPAIAEIADAHPLDPQGHAAQKIASLGAGGGNAAAHVGAHPGGACPRGYVWDGQACVPSGHGAGV